VGAAIWRQSRHKGLSLGAQNHPKKAFTALNTNPKPLGSLEAEVKMVFAVAWAMVTWMPKRIRAIRHKAWATGQIELFTLEIGTFLWSIQCSGYGI
jgi:hypothetical protein